MDEEFTDFLIGSSVGSALAAFVLLVILLVVF